MMSAKLDINVVICKKKHTNCFFFCKKFVGSKTFAKFAFNNVYQKP